MAKRVSAIDRIAAEQVATQWVAANLLLMQSIASACHVGPHEITGPAVDAVASILSREPDPACNGANVDPACNVALITDYCRRELSPRGPTVDPQSLEMHGGVTHPMDLLTAGFYDAPAVWAAGRAKRARLPNPLRIDHGQNHREAWHRQAEKRTTALTFGQLGFCGLDWRSPAANDDDFDGDDFDGEGVTA